MNIVKFVDFIKEDISDNPEEYIKMELMKLKKKIDLLFDKTNPSDSEEDSEK